jgi:hypothetical protein
VWGGIIWTRIYHSENENLEITASTPESYFARRRIQHTLNYVSVNQHQIMANLVAYAQGGIVTGPGDIGVRPPASIAPAQARDRKYLWGDFAAVLDRMTELSQVVGGPDFTISPTTDPDQPPHWILETGTPLGAKHNVVWEFPGDIVSYDWPDDGGNSANFWIAQGDVPPGAGDDAPNLVAKRMMTAEWAAGIPLLEDFSQHQGVINFATLAGYAEAQLLANAGNRHLATFKLVGQDDLPGLGDEIQIRITDPYRFPADPIDHTIVGPGLVAQARVTGWTVNYSVDQGETLDVTIGESEVIGGAGVSAAA